MNNYASLILLTASFLALPAQAQEEKPDEVVTYKSVGEVELALHVFHPPAFKASDKRPAIVFFFGGGWVGGSPQQFYPQSRRLADRGMVAFCAEYRTRNKHQTTPAECVKDGKSAVRWVRQHAAELGVDANRIAAGGGSAGGHVAAATATTQGFEEDGEDHSVSCRPNALVLFNPVFDNGPDGYGHDRVLEYWRAFSPLHNIDRKTPPTIVFLGTKDKLIPVATAKSYQQRMQDAGRRCDLHLYEGAAHGFFNRGDAFSDTLEKTDRFLTSLGYLKENLDEEEATPENPQRRGRLG